MPTQTDFGIRGLGFISDVTYVNKEEKYILDL